MSETPHFELTPVGDQKLYLPDHIANPKHTAHLTQRELGSDHQTMLAQIEVMGTDGYGSIKNESSEYGQEDPMDNADLARSLKDMVDPKNVIELKRHFDTTMSQAKAEKQLSIDKRLDKDGAKAADEKQSAAALKASMIESYTQIGMKDGEQRNVPESYKMRINELMDLSYKQLEKQIDANKPIVVVPAETPVDGVTEPTIDEAKAEPTEPVVDAKPEKLKLIDAQKQYREVRSRARLAINNNDAESYKAAKDELIDLFLYIAKEAKWSKELLLKRLYEQDEFFGTTLNGKLEIPDMKEAPKQKKTQKFINGTRDKIFKAKVAIAHPIHSLAYFNEKLDRPVPDKLKTASHQAKARAIGAMAFYNTNRFS